MSQFSVEVDMAVLDPLLCRGAPGFHAFVLVGIIADPGLYSDVMCWMQGHLLVFTVSFLVIMDSDTSSSSSVTMSYEDYYIDQGHLLPLKRGSSVVPETGGKYSLFISLSAVLLTAC